MPVVVEIKGLTRIMRSLDRLPRDLTRLLASTMDSALSSMRDYVEPYPPLSEANRPKYGTWGPWYNRGVGSAYTRQDGEVTQYLNSERLSSRWSQSVSFGPYTLEGRVGNTASYARDVHSDTHQPAFHAARGWKTVQAAVQEKRVDIVQSFALAARVILKRMGW